MHPRTTTTAQTIYHDTRVSTMAPGAPAHPFPAKPHDQQLRVATDRGSRVAVLGLFGKQIGQKSLPPSNVPSFPVACSIT